MTNAKKHELTIRVIQTERECVARQQCDRDCGRCDLVMDADEILAAYDYVLDILKEKKYNE